MLIGSLYGPVVAWRAAERPGQPWARLSAGLRALVVLGLIGTVADRKHAPEAGSAPSRPRHARWRRRTRRRRTPRCPTRTSSAPRGCARPTRRSETPAGAE